MGKPIVASCIDGITEQIENGVTGLLVSPKDIDALSSAIIKLLDNREMCQKLGRTARYRVGKDFSVEKMVNETKKIYHFLCQLNP